MAGGLRYETVADMPPGMRQRMVAQVLEKYSGAQLPSPEDSCRGEECILWWECNGVAVNEECPYK